MNATKVLPSETIQKEFELNPLKILESLGKENFEIEENSENEKNESAETSRKSSIEEKDDINYIYTNNLNCRNSLINDNQNDLNKFNCFNIMINSNCNEQGKNKENTFVNNIVNNSNYNNNDIYINSIKDKDQIICNNSCNDNINIKNLPLDNNNSFKLNSNVVNKPINISKLLSNLKTYKGSIYAQTLLDQIYNEEDLDKFFNEIIPNICQIMCSEYGNYFFQKLIKKLSLSQKLNIYQIIQPEFLIIATNKWGTHSIQSLMDNIQSPMEYQALNLLISKNMYLLFTDDNAYHIMMKVILEFPEDQRLVLNLFLVTNVDKIITNNNGAFCVNKFIVNNKNLKLRKLLIDNLQYNLKKIIFNKFCCINLLLILQTFGIEWGAFIISEIQKNFITLIDNPVSRIFVMKVLELLKNCNYYFLKELLWSLYRNIILMRFLVMNKKKKKILNQLIEYSENEQKEFLLILSKSCNW